MRYWEIHYENGDVDEIETYRHVGFSELMEMEGVVAVYELDEEGQYIKGDKN